MTIAFVFPGQGSQSVGMLGGLAVDEPLVTDTFAEASSVLGYDLWTLCQNGPAEQLSSTSYTQPAMLTAAVATYRVWRKRGGSVPALMAGHSLGEYTALVCAGALEFAAAVDLVRFRGEAMQAAVPPGQGAMAALLGIDDAAVEAVCREAAQSEIVVPANYNSPGQIVIAGHATAVDRAIELATARGAKRAIRLPVSVPSHSPLMQPAAEQLRERLRSVAFRAPADVTIYTVDLATHASEEGIRTALEEQLVKPVRWSETVTAMLRAGATAVFECGPGKVLTGLNRRIERDRAIAMLALEDSASIDEALTICRENQHD
ncbi:MAG TPA: ACP S-malonyltransferase [Steroidobacteraceae bacterium]|nr:ACP S-malonyltransferase [Steroidobacteraceae bacterium]